MGMTSKKMFFRIEKRGELNETENGSGII